jgi:predicted permease
VSSRPPRLARWLLRVRPLGAHRVETESDLLELYHARAVQRGSRYAARRYFGDVLSLWIHLDRSQSRPVARPTRRLMQGFAQDVTYALRLFRRHPGVVAVTIIGLGVAIGVSTSVFSLLNAVAFRPTGVVDPSSVVWVLRAHEDGMSTSWPYADYVQLRERGTLVTLESWLGDAVSWSASPTPDDGASVGGTFVTGGYLSTLGARAMLGRMLTPADDTIGALPVIVVSHGFWSRALAGDPAVVGRTVWLNRVAVSIVGVAERGCTGASDASLSFWAPLGEYHVLFGGRPFGHQTSTSVNIVGRIRPGVAFQQAQAGLGAVAVGVSSVRVDSSGSPITGVRLLRSSERMTPSERRTVAIVTAIVITVIGLVLLLACVNVANLLLASAASRQREIGVRLALGASRGRIVRQLLTESVMLGLVGGVMGLLFTVWLVPVLARVTRAPAGLDVAPDLRVYLFLAIVSVIAGLGAGLAPARHGTRGDVASPLKGEGVRSETFTHPARLRSALIGVQAAASIVLLVLASLLTRAMVRATQIDVGFEAGRLLTVAPAFGRGPSDAARTKRYFDMALDRVRALPGVRAASLVAYPPFGNMSSVSIFRRAGSRYTLYHNQTRADYFGILGLRVVRGRVYTEDEVTAGAPVAVISESVARDFWPGEDPIGGSLERIFPRDARVERSGAAGDSSPIVIGVVSDVITARLRDLSAATVYQPLAASGAARMIIRADVPPEMLFRSLRAALQPIDPRIHLDIPRVSDGPQQQVEEPRVLAALAAALAAIALALAVVGIYGVTTFVVGQRTREIGVRIAIGASGSDVMRLLLGDSLRPVLVGLSAGVVAAVIGGQVFSAVLFGVRPSDPLALAGAVVLLLGAAIVAVVVPTRHAARVDPASVLRQL